MSQGFRGTAVLKQVAGILLALFAGMPQALDALHPNPVDSAAAHGVILLQEEEWKADDGAEWWRADARTLPKPFREDIRCLRHNSAPALGHERIPVPPPKA